jgi:lysophospholipase L1-like esterase
MIGVNGDSYGYWERRYTPELIDTIHARNTNSYMYVLNGLPYPNNTDPLIVNQLYSFNEMLDSIVAFKLASGWNIRLVDAFSALAPDSVFNPVLFYDNLHPNEAGYEILAQEILNVMKNDW